MLPGDVYSEDMQAIVSESYPWEKLSGTKVLVTGATGMVGSLLTDVLVSMSEEYRFDVVAMSRGYDGLKALFSVYSDNPHLSLIAHDVNTPIDGAFDSIFHLASNTHPAQYATDPIGTVSTNVMGLNNLLDAVSKGAGGRFVFASSVEVYGQNRGDVESFDESYCGYIDCNTLRAGYNESKRVGEALCQAYGSQRDVDFVIPRLSRLYGPTMRADDSKASSQFIKKAVAREDIVLKSAGTQYYSYCYSADAVSAILYLFFKGSRGQAYNVSGLDSDITLRGMAEMLADIAGTKVVFEVPDAQESAGYSKASTAIMDTSKIESLGWRPRVNLRDGLVRTVSALRRSSGSGVL